MCYKEHKARNILHKKGDTKHSESSNEHTTSGKQSCVRSFPCTEWLLTEREEEVVSLGATKESNKTGRAQGFLKQPFIQCIIRLIFFFKQRENLEGKKRKKKTTRFSIQKSEISECRKIYKCR